ncbi:MAG: ABC transporter permease [Defluviitaleaceae bacterium]|nr:ABC transporter permease [Defluviitaleaceae bacterium]
MRKFFNLILNEYIKILGKLSTKLLLCLLFAASLFMIAVFSTHGSINESRSFTFREEAPQDAAPESWQDTLIRQIETTQTSLLQVNDEQLYLHLRDAITLNEYRLANGIEHHAFRGMEFESLNPANALPDFWRGFPLSVMTIMFLSVLIIVVAGGIVAGEHSSGTIQPLLINPVKRWKFLLAKYIAVLTFGLVLLIPLFAANVLFTGLFFGFGGYGVPLLTVVDGEVAHRSAMLYMASRYLLSAVGMFALATFAFALSALTRSAALAIGLGVFLYVGGIGVVATLQDLGFYQARYILFANTQILDVIDGTTGFVHHTLRFALLNISAYMAVFLWTAWDAFTRSDIK